MRFLILLMTVSMIGCEPPRSIEKTEEAGYEVDKVFVKDGITIYRFWDGGNRHYFTSCGETMSTWTSGAKAKTTHHENIK